jgi:DNA-binding YbaB/EbfC family protein
MKASFIHFSIGYLLQCSNFAANNFIKLINMFGDLMGMMGKLKETQRKVEETKKRMDTILIDEQSSDELLKVTVTANRAIKSIAIDDVLLDDKEQLEDYLLVVLNKAIQKASDVNQAELDAVAKVDLPMIPGMENMFK